MAPTTDTTTHFTRVCRIVDQIGYRPDYWFRVLMDSVLTDDIPPYSTVFVQLEHNRQDADTGQWGTGRSGRAYLVPEMTDSEIVRKCLALALAYEEHEVREFFTYKGARVFGPHLSVDALAEIAHRLDVRS